MRRAPKTAEPPKKRLDPVGFQPQLPCHGLARRAIPVSEPERISVLLAEVFAAFPEGLAVGIPLVVPLVARPDRVRFIQIGEAGLDLRPPEAGDKEVPRHGSQIGRKSGGILDGRRLPEDGQEGLLGKVLRLGGFTPQVAEIPPDAPLVGMDQDLQVGRH